ncbi:hypothetical protein [Citreimonas salinaria]|uniref:Uncharacterized protein n=1 Tax=Citreimonas salinaria TaxID=321339 RepID=A0A1H3MHB4_9RHOB|nr:hypothetical protein [Citreimonas salinaria]SDY76026.1 hypothetical protein SAMN05444340_11727 [Citreimonas salinaria]
MKSDKRQVAHLSDMSRSKIDEHVAAVQLAFDEDWLINHGDNIVRNLWHRTDAGATNEIINLGYALIEADKKKAGLASSFARRIKKQEINNQRGLLFELFVIGCMFARRGRVEPTPANEPGYDLRISFQDGGELLLSLKSWGTSTHERTFRKKAARLDQFVQKIAHETACHSVNVRAAAASYPEEKAWSSLRSACQEALRGQPTERSSRYVGDEWMLVIGPVWSPNGPICRNRLSHEVFVLSPYHKNEIPNFRDKLKGAINNAERYVKESPNRAHGIIARVPTNLSWSDANAVVKNHFDDNPNGPIGIVFLIQTAVITDESGRSMQQFFVQTHVSKGHKSWSSPERDFGLRLLLGVVSDKASKNVIASDDGQNIDLEDFYHYHSGDLFVRFDGNEGTLARLAPGLRQHAVMRIGANEVVFSGIFPQNDDLIMFD